MSGVQALGTNLLHAVDLAAADAASRPLALLRSRHREDARGFGLCSSSGGGIVVVRFPGDLVEFGCLDLHS